MRLRARSYHDITDLVNIRQLLTVGSQTKIPASYMHPGCVEVAIHYPPADQSPQRNLRLWESVEKAQPELAAWAIFLPHEETFDLFVHPTLFGTPVHEMVMDEYVAWAEARAREVGLTQIWPFWAMDYDTVLTRLMVERGFEVVETDPPPPLFESALDEVPPVQLPDGFTVQGVQNTDDCRSRAAVTYNAFGSDDDWARYTTEYGHFMRSDVYDGERDLFVRSPEGRGASACTIWFDEVNDVGLFEPVATHPDYQGKGLGKAVMAEGMHRMKAAGMRSAIVGFDPNNAAALALYRSMGFSASSYFLICRKTLSADGS